MNVLPGGTGVSDEEKAERLAYALSLLDGIEAHCHKQLIELDAKFNPFTQNYYPIESIFYQLTGDWSVLKKISKSDKSKIREINLIRDYASTINNIKEAKRCAAAGELANSIINTMRAMNSLLQNDAKRGALRRTRGGDGAKSKEPKNRYKKDLAMKINAEILERNPGSSDRQRARDIRVILGKRLQMEWERDKARDPDRVTPDMEPVSVETIRDWLKERTGKIRP